MPLGYSNLRRLSAGSRFPVLPYTFHGNCRDHYLTSNKHVLLCFLDLLSLVKFSVRYAIWLESPLPVFLQVFLAESKYSVGLSIVLLSFETLRHTLWYRRFWRVCVAYCSLAIPHSTVLLGCSFTGTPLMCTLLGGAPSRFGGCRSSGFVG